MPVYRPNIPPHVAVVIRHFPPDIKASVKSALRYLSEIPVQERRSPENLRVIGSIG